MSAQPVNPSVPPDHVTIEIDGRELVVPKGVNIIQAADRAGIVIPRFCYHEKLPVAANCRVCMVEVEMGGRPMPKPAPACATPVADGMKVHTLSDKALAGQRNALEFLLINHPLDCPVCDQGGECELQDLTMGFGRSVSRFAERKRVVADEDLGPLVESEMTRCIHCTRCVRVMSEVAGTYELGGLERGERLQIGTYVGKPLMSELSGNVIDVCPVGALTDKPFRFRARPWELIARESIGYHDALGSNLWLHTRRGEVLRCVPRDNEAINECWLSDRDRYSRDALRAPDRAAKPRVKRDGDWLDVDWNEAIRVAAGILRETPQGGLGALVHPATSNEEGHLLASMVRALGSEHIDHRLRQLDCSGDGVAPVFGMPVADVERAEVIVLVGCNPRHEMPLLAARIRKAARHGARIFAINPLDFDFDFEFAPDGRRIVAPDTFLDAVQALGRAAGGEDSFEGTVAAALREAASSVIVFGEAAQMHPQAGQLRAAVRELARATQAACNEIPLGANAIGLSRAGVLPGGAARDAQGMLAEPCATYVLYGCEPPEDFADGRKTLDALGKAGQVIAFAAYTSAALERVASVILPIALLPESEATLVNVDGIEQCVAAAAKPPGEARPGWRVLRALGAALALDGFDFIEIAELRERLGSAVRPARGEPAPPRSMQRLENGFAADLPANLRAAPVAAVTDQVPAGEGPRPLRRIATTAIYSTDAVVRRAAPLQAHPLARAACVTLHPDDAGALGLSHGGHARVNGSPLPVETSPRVPRGGAWIEAGLAATATLPPYGAFLDISKA
ncbi:NADH-quinone oxidoreductase subunit NuoG [Dokdonella sp.]|uniref:NADH-quinone oxidoreductase subunit NuoG n=1 Tax=Dokdonella sp. TaxID=2291710 RepID=UPI0031C170C6|nr:NADH-quinone oxidoreductase subunit NuoG [Dokdonella sp.]